MERSNRAIRIGLFTDALPDRSLAEVARWAERTGVIDDLELGVGGYSPAPHMDSTTVPAGDGALKHWRKPIDDAGLGISALNVSGNPLHPNPEIAARHDRDLRDAIRLAAALGVDRVVAMSGCPGAGPDDRHAPHFSGGGWLPDLERISEWQWRERVAPYWTDLAEFARREHDELLICFELHPGTYVFNFETFARMRALGDNLAVNLDPSHFFWQSMDPLAMVSALGDRVAHVHGKDTTLDARRMSLNGVLDTRWPIPPTEMPWNFATVGRGHDQTWWTSFVGLLRDYGFDGTVSIEYEDPFVAPEESILESATMLSTVIAGL
ncbi:MAG TPA: sugar phosphate isomerase/epimerase [Candidatus Dormibacteraeota bacterium]|nr:sugar phosphate isomerase/epimerase [Candidatus Dormibacteraeota bacterium]